MTAADASYAQQQTNVCEDSAGISHHLERLERTTIAMRCLTHAQIVHTKALSMSRCSALLLSLSLPPPRSFSYGSSCRAHPPTYPPTHPPLTHNISLSAKAKHCYAMLTRCSNVK